MSQARVTSLVLGFEGSTATYRISVDRVPGHFSGGREVDARYMHPEARAALATWAGADERAQALGELQRIVDAIEPETELHDQLSKILGKLR